MRLLRPEPFQFPSNIMRGQLFYNFDVTDIFHPNIPFRKAFQGLSIGTATEVFYMGEIPPPEGDSVLYFGTQNHINNCVNNAETINLKLKNLLGKLIINRELRAP